MKTIRVAAAVIREHDKIFATARGYGDLKGGWEFPGGKIEAGETPKEALVREIREELDVVIDAGELIDTIEYDYSDFHLSMDCFWCRIVEGELTLKEAEDSRWLTADTLDTVAWLPADLELIEKIREELGLKSRISLINASCADQEVDVVVNAANGWLWAGSGICGVIFRKAGMKELTGACSQYETPVEDGSAVITPAFHMKNTKAIIHAVGPDFGRTPSAFQKLYEAYYNSLVVLKEHGYHSISFPLISAGIFGGNLENPAAESAKQCCRAYRDFIENNPEYRIDVRLCAFSQNEMIQAEKVFRSEALNDPV